MVSTLFDKVYVINLERRQDRLEKISENLNELNIYFERFEALDYLKIESEPSVACALSHRGVIEKAKAEGNKSILVLEDDCYFVDGFIDKFNLLIDSLPEDWDMLYLGSSANEGETISGGLRKTIRCLTSHAIGIKDTVYDKLIEINKGTIHVDHAYMSIMSDLNVYSAYPSLIKQSAGYSDISNLNASYDHLIV